MRQDYTNWYPAIQSELKSLLDTKWFEITFLPPGITAIYWLQVGFQTQNEIQTYW
jgi:hypothetical protein